MEDDFTKVRISKTDIATGEELPGATLQIVDESGKTVVEWVSGDEPHYFERIPVGTYKLVEVSAPAGYLVAESITFDVDATGEIQRVEMKDARIPETPHVPQTGDLPWLPAVLAIVGTLAGMVLVLKWQQKRDQEKEEEAE